MDCASGNDSATAVRMGRPPIYAKDPLFVRVAPGVKERIAALAPDKRQGDIARDVLMRGLEAMEGQGETVAAQAGPKVTLPKVKPRTTSVTPHALSPGKPSPKPAKRS